MFATPAYAQAAGGPGGMGGLDVLIPFILMFVIFYFLLIRPQQKRLKEHRKMVEELRRGDEVITAGGIYGKVTRVFGKEKQGDKEVDTDQCEIQVAEGVKIRVVKSTITAVVAKTEPAKNA